MMKRYRCLSVLALSWLAATTQASSHGHLRRGLQSPRQYFLWAPEEIHSTLQSWADAYPNLVRVTTAQAKYGLQTAGTSSDCPYDSGDGCLNYFMTIQDYLVNPVGSPSSNVLPEVIWSGEVHGDERVGPTAVMEAAALLLEAAQCEATFDTQVYETCSAALEEQGIGTRHRKWLARLVATRRIVVVPTANALGYYRNTRTEEYIDTNRDFPFDLTDPRLCMQTIGARTLNELYREHMFQMALTFHGGVEMVGYEWGATSYAGVLSPDDEAQGQIAEAYSQYGGSWTGTNAYPFGTMDVLIYTVRGGMEDWAYAGSWIPDKVSQCQPDTYGGYAAEKTVYNDSMLRAFNMLVETSNDKVPDGSILGTSLDVLSKDTSGNGHVSRNIRLSLLSADLVEPYLSFVGVNELSLTEEVVPLWERGFAGTCRTMNQVLVPKTLGQVTVEWTVGGALEIDDTSLWYGKWDNVSGLDCLSQPASDISSSLTQGLGQPDLSGTGYFSRFGVTPSSTGTTGEPPLGPVFKADVDLSAFQVGDEVVVLVKARVDQSWAEQPSNIVPQVSPQAHLVNARTNPDWYHESAGKIIQGRLDWYSIIPLTLVVGSATDELVDVSDRFGNRDEIPSSGAPVTTSAPTTTAGITTPTDAPTTTSSDSATEWPTASVSQSTSQSDAASGESKGTALEDNRTSLAASRGVASTISYGALAVAAFTLAFL